MKEMKKRILFDAAAVAERVKGVAAEISRDYPGGNVLLIGILKGAFMFMADLARSLTIPCEIDFARISSYGSGTVSSGKLTILLDAGIPVKGRDVILVDDIVDSGLTLSEYRRHIEQQGPRSVKTAAMIDKTGRRERHVALDYRGFKLEGGFLVGYGLDCDECFRYLDGIYVIEE